MIRALGGILSIGGVVLEACCLLSDAILYGLLCHKEAGAWRAMLADGVLRLLNQSVCKNEDTQHSS